MATATTPIRTPYDAVPEWLERRQEISAEAKLLFARLLGYSRRLGHVFPGQARLARELGLGSDRAIRRLLAELREHGLIKTTRRGYNRTLVYRVIWDHPWRTQYEAARVPRPPKPSQGDFFSPSSAGPDRRDAPPIQTQTRETRSGYGSSSARARVRPGEEEKRESPKIAPRPKEQDERSALVDQIIEVVQRLARLGVREPIRSLSGYRRTLLTHDLATLERELAEQQAHLIAATRAAEPSQGPSDPRAAAHSAVGATPPELERIEPGYELAHARALAVECAHLGAEALHPLIAKHLVARGVEPGHARQLATEAIEGAIAAPSATVAEVSAAGRAPAELVEAPADLEVPGALVSPDADPTGQQEGAPSRVEVAHQTAEVPGAQPLTPPEPPEQTAGTLNSVAWIAISPPIEVSVATDCHPGAEQSPCSVSEGLAVLRARLAALRSSQPDNHQDHRRRAPDLAWRTPARDGPLAAPT